MNVLLLGGTAEARQLAELLVELGVSVVTSLAGVTNTRRALPGEVRVGGFGGATGLADYLREQEVGAVVDATHPFASQISANAALACEQSGIGLLRLVRPGWAQHPNAARWHWVSSLAEAKVAAGQLGQRVFLSIGGQELAAFAGLTTCSVVARVIDPPDFSVPANWQLVSARGPFSYDQEVKALGSNRIEVLVTKDSGGVAAKLDAAAALGVEVVIVRRPGEVEGVPRVDSVAQAASWLRGLAVGAGERGWFQG